MRELRGAFELHGSERGKPIRVLARWRLRQADTTADAQELVEDVFDLEKHNPLPEDFDQRADFANQVVALSQGGGVLAELDTTQNATWDESKPESGWYGVRHEDGEEQGYPEFLISLIVGGWFWDEPPTAQAWTVEGHEDWGDKPDRWLDWRPSYPCRGPYDEVELGAWIRGLGEFRPVSCIDELPTLLMDHAGQGARRSGAWERRWLSQVTGESGIDWELRQALAADMKNSD